MNIWRTSENRVRASITTYNRINDDGKDLFVDLMECENDWVGVK